jgi:hypothetical protein
MSNAKSRFIMHAVTHAMSSSIHTILFGAFDRHNFGDLLFAHVAAALLPEKSPVFAGVAECDLRCYGGHHVEALAGLAARWRDRPVSIVHAGGELLTCNAWEAAVMTLPPEEAADIIARFDAHPHEALEWAQGRIGIAALAPYTMQRTLFPQARSVIYNAVGGVDLQHRDPALRAEVLANLQAADAVGVRDRATQAQLRAAGIPARLMPDPVVMVAELFGDDIGRRAAGGGVAEVLHTFPQGYLAVQFSADFGDDATLAEMAAQLDALVQATGYGIVFFCAGVAPWHDDPACFQRVSARMQHRTARFFRSLDIWDICALISASRGYLGSSLHGRIVAMAFALPRLNLVHSMEVSKQASYASTWENAGMPLAVQVQGIAQGMQDALGTDERSRMHKARELAECYRHEFHALCTGRFSFGNP